MDWNSGRGTFDGMRAADHPRHTSRQATRFTTCENRGTLDRGVSPVRVRALTRDPEPSLTGPVKRPLPSTGAGAYLQRADSASPDAGSPPTDAGTAPTDATPPDAGLPPADPGGAPAGPETGDRGTESRGTDRRGVGDDQQDVAGSLVTFRITWHGHFGDDLSARIFVAGITKPRRGRPKLDQLHDTTVIDSDKEGRKSGERLGPAVLSVARYRWYRVWIEPLNDRYKTTLVTKEIEVPSTLSEVPLDKKLTVNRENKKNVADSWNWRKIDPVQARRKRKVLLFGRPVTVHDYVLPRVAITNLIFASRPAAVRREISESIYRLGGENERTTTLGGFSNHSIGVAFDINDNGPTRQNDHFFKKNTALLTKVIEPIARIDRRFVDFAIFGDKGLTQLRASQAFIERFPIYVAALLNRTQDVADLERHTKEMAALKGSTRAANHAFLRDQIVKDLSSKANKAKFGLIVKNEKKKSDLQKRLRLILAHWKTLFTWVLGADVKDTFTKQTKRAVGMIPLHPGLLEIMLAAGWSWGGDWNETKDYMHFEDRGLQKQLKRPSPSSGGSGKRPTSVKS